MPGRRSNIIAAVPELLKLLQSKLWFNDDYKVFFSTRKTHNPQEYYCFFLDTHSEVRKHGHYRIQTDAIVVDFLNWHYTVRELEGMRKYDIPMIQLTNMDNSLVYMNFICKDIPVIKGKPYIIERYTLSK